MSVCIKCRVAETVDPLPDSGGSVSFDQLYCAACLKEEAESGKFNPMQVPLPDVQPHDNKESRQD